MGALEAIAEVYNLVRTEPAALWDAVNRSY